MYHLVWMSLISWSNVHKLWTIFLPHAHRHISISFLLHDFNSTQDDDEEDICWRGKPIENECLCECVCVCAAPFLSTRWWKKTKFNTLNSTAMIKMLSQNTELRKKSKEDWKKNCEMRVTEWKSIALNFYFIIFFLSLLLLVKLKVDFLCYQETGNVRVNNRIKRAIFDMF